MVLCVQKHVINVFLQSRAVWKLCIPAKVFFFSCALLYVWEFLCKYKSVFVLTKLPLSSQWVTCWPPQDCAYVCVAITQHGGSSPGLWACFNTRHRWVAPWACCGGLPSAASSGCPDSKLIRLTVTRILILLIPYLCVTVYLTSSVSHCYRRACSTRSICELTHGLMGK